MPPRRRAQRQRNDAVDTARENEAARGRGAAFETKMDGILNILNDLTEEEKSQLSDKQKKAVKALISSKPSVPFHKATLNDCVRPDGLALNIDWIRVKAPTLHIPVDFAAPIASAHLCETLAKIDKVWVLDNEKSCRIVIDAILTEVLLNETNHELMGFCEVKNDWEGTGFGYTGDVDYMFGSSKMNGLPSQSPKLLSRLVACLRNVWLLERTPLCLPF